MIPLVIRVPSPNAIRTAAPNLRVCGMQTKTMPSTIQSWPTFPIQVNAATNESRAGVCIVCSASRMAVSFIGNNLPFQEKGRSGFMLTESCLDRVERDKHFINLRMF